MVNTKEYEWSDVTVVVAGRPVTGLRGVKYGSKQEKELLYAKGNKPHGIQHGNVDYSGELTLLQSEYQALKSAAYGNPENGDPITTDILKGVELTEDQTEWKQGDKFQEKSLPFIYIDQKSL